MNEKKEVKGTGLSTPVTSALIASLDGRCCVCGHPLSTHVEEEGGWRCHCVSVDGYQCECWLRKNRDATGGEDISYYDLARRIQENPESIPNILKELKETEEQRPPTASQKDDWDDVDEFMSGDRP